MSLSSRDDRPYTVPDFQADEAVRTRYTSVARELINAAVSRGLAAVRAENDAIRLRHLLIAQEAESAQRAASAAAHRARAKYATVVPRQRTASGIVRPPTVFFDIIMSMGAADKFYNEAIATAQTKHDADAAARTAFANLERLKSKAEAAVVVRELEIRRHFKTENGRLELDADARLHGTALECAAIEAERNEFAQRLSAGTVSDEELRDRTMAHEGSRFLDGDVRGLHALRDRDVRYGKLRYFTFRDAEGRLWLFDYSDDWRLLLHVTFDLVLASDRYLVARSASEGTRQANGRTQARLPGPDPRARVGVDPLVTRALVDFVARERTTL